jgi:hypothetical protein
MTGTSNSAQPTSGTTQATASACLADHVSVPTAGAGEGVILTPGNSGDIRSVTNADQDSELLVYPPVGAQFNGVTANVPLNLPRARAGLFIFTSPTTIMAVFS